MLGEAGETGTLTNSYVTEREEIRDRNFQVSRK